MDEVCTKLIGCTSRTATTFLAVEVVPQAIRHPLERLLAQPTSKNSSSSLAGVWHTRCSNGSLHTSRF